MNLVWRWLVLGLTATSLAACTHPNSVPDTPLAQLSADVAAMKAFPSATISRRCDAALRDLTAKVKDIAALEQRGKGVDAVSSDVLESDQNEAEAACHPDAVRICQAPASPEATRACSRVVGMALHPSRAGE
jgi:hypothetical protein